MLNLGRQHPKDVWKKGNKILKLPPVRNCFTLAMTNKLVVIINSLKVTKIKKVLLFEVKFLVPNYSCLQNPLTRGLPPPDPRSLCPQLNLLNPPRTKFLGTSLRVDSMLRESENCALRETFGHKWEEVSGDG